MQPSTNDSISRAWQVRDGLYHELFGPHKDSVPKIFAPPAPLSTDDEISQPHELVSMLGKTIKEKDIPILIYEPHELRPYWMYATSGLSNPWFGQLENDVSGFGCELVVKSKSKARWPIRLLRRLVYYILSYSGTLSPGVMLTLDAPLFTKPPSELSSILVWYVDEAPDCIYQLPSGVFGIFSIIGISEDESDFVRSADKYGCWCMQQILRQTGLGQTTDPHRQSVMKQDNIGSLISSVRTYAENFAQQEPQ